MFSLLYLFVALVVSHFGIEGRTLALTALVPGHCLPFTLYNRPILRLIDNILITKMVNFVLILFLINTYSDFDSKIRKIMCPLSPQPYFI